MEVVGRLMKVSGVERLVNGCECGVLGLGVVLEKLKNRRRKTGREGGGEVRMRNRGEPGAKVVVTEYT